MKFDELIAAPCAPGNEHSGGNDPATCEPFPPVGPSTDPRCLDPAFAAANPSICAGFPKLLLKPEFSMTESGKTVQYRTFIRTDSNEQELLQGLAYSSSDIGVVIVEAKHGLATAVMPGIATVSVKWAALSAFAQFEVVGSCGQVGNNFLLLIDNSKSSSAAFSGSFATRLSYAKETAIKFAQSVNYAKDKVAVAFFNEGVQITLALSNNLPAIVNAIQSITSTNSFTDIANGLKLGMIHLNNYVSEGKVIVLFSDGESNRGQDPLVYSEPWKSSGRLIVGVALRAWGSYFDKMYRLSSTGYFLSAYEATEDTVSATLNGLKSYFCSGDCPPKTGTYPKAKLNHKDFVNWNVFQGSVDLIGLDNWDVLPGNGLYVDLAGTLDPLNPAASPSPGGIESKNTFSLVSGHTYRFRIDVAGNNVGQLINPPVRVRITSADGTVKFTDDTITPSGPTQPFVRSEFMFIAQASKPVRIKIEMIPVPIDQLGQINVGPLVDDISLRDMTSNTLLLDDTFDSENLVTVPAGSYYASTHGCLDAPPGTQQADPTPPSLIEV